VRIYDGFGSLAHTLEGLATGVNAGRAVAGIGDANNDGVQDYAYSAPQTNVLFVGNDAGRVYAFSGSNNAPLFSPTGSGPSTFFGTALSGLGDFNGDGHDDFLIGSENENLHGTVAGEARVVSGANGNTLASWHAGVGTFSGASVSAAGDLNGDGLDDAVFGATWSPAGIGSAQVRLAGLGDNIVYCVASVNSQGCTPEIDATGVASRSIANSLHVTASQVLNNQFGMLFYGFAQNNAPFQGGTLCVQTPLRRTAIQHSGGNAGPSDCSGTYDFHFSHAFMAAENIAPGLKVHAQYWSRDPFSPNTGLTDAVRFDVVP
jgi:FG-GAP-like repeat